MKYSLTIRKEAELDINRAFEYYEIQRLGLGHDFLLCLDVRRLGRSHFFVKHCSP